MLRKILILFSFALAAFTLASAQKVRPPQQLRVEKTFQREVEIVWNKTLLENIEWEILVEGQEPVRTQEIKYIVSDLEPDSEYKVSIRMVSGTNFSESADLLIKTKPMDYKVDDPQRVPYLRCISIEGDCPKQLPVFFNDLASSDAKIVYKHNGVEVKPVNHLLQLVAKNYTDKLEVLIDEGNNKKFRLLYFINIPKEN